MTDGQLITFGAVVFFTAFSGGYIYVRNGLLPSRGPARRTAVRPTASHASGAGASARS